jgi:uncharacterized membrane protein
MGIAVSGPEWIVITMTGHGACCVIAGADRRNADLSASVVGVDVWLVWMLGWAGLAGPGLGGGRVGAVEFEEVQNGGCEFEFGLAGSEPAHAESA